MKKILKHLVVSVALASAISAYAVPTLTIFDGTTTYTVTDNGGGATPDANPLPGVVHFSGPIGTWTVNVDTGITKPVLGSMTFPHMDLAYSVVGVGDLQITFSDDGFVYNGGLADHFGGTTGAGVGNTTVNTVLVDGAVVGSFTQGPYGPGAFSGDSSGVVSLAAGNTLALRVDLHHAVNINSSGNKDVIAVPDGGTTLVLLGSGLTVLGFLRRKLVKG